MLFTVTLIAKLSCLISFIVVYTAAETAASVICAAIPKPNVSANGIIPAVIKTFPNTPPVHSLKQASLSLKSKSAYKKPMNRKYIYSIMPAI